MRPFWSFLELSQARNFSRFKVHIPDLEVCCDWSTFFPLKSADVSGAGTRDEPLRMSSWEPIIGSHATLYRYGA